MDHGIDSFDGSDQAFWILDGPFCEFHTGKSVKMFTVRATPNQRPNLVPLGTQLLRDVTSQKPSSTGQKNTHGFAFD
jgi:hypothetical protein